MDVRSFLIIFLVTAYSCCLGLGYDNQENTYNVLNFGASGNGQNDDSQAFLKAWKTACGTSKGTPMVLVPRGKTFLLNPLTFDGPCKSNSIRFQIDGNIVAPQTPSGWKSACKNGIWVHFLKVNNLTISGAGTIDGRGAMWWKKGTNAADLSCKAPAALSFHHCDNLGLEEFTSLNSPNKHICLESCYNVQVAHVHIRAPANSPNTDGILISDSSHVNISESFIGTGDDCISIKRGSSYIYVFDVACGPGHGISIGSLGEGGRNNTVEEVHVRNCNFTGTTNCARIKTWKGGSGYAKAISFEHIKILGSKYPIIIDQNYGAHGTGTAENHDVKISNVTFKDFVGTSMTKQAIKLDCAPSGCNDIVMDQVTLVPANSQNNLTSFCKNADGRATSTSPPVPCLSNGKM